MTQPTIYSPAGGARVVAGQTDVVLFGQPPEVLKALLSNDIPSFNTLVLTDIREKDGSLTNNLEFPLYFFLFYTGGHAEGRRLTLVGEEADISHAIRLLRFTLVGPTAAELERWGTAIELKQEWLQVAEALALKDGDDNVIAVQDFFDIRPFRDGEVQLSEFTISHAGLDKYQVSNGSGQVSIDLSQDLQLAPPYPVLKDNISVGLVKLGLDVLGGASGFSPDEPCTGLALCHNGDYILIDAMPFLDQHLRARGISKNQILAIFLTHLHDDHCSMFPLMLMPHVVEVITTREIFEMAMEKLSCGLGWNLASVEQHFQLFEIKPGEPVNYYGLVIEPHLTVHSIPTVGATFSAFHQGSSRQICVIGDNHSMSAIEELKNQGLVRAETVNTLQDLYRNYFSLLIADGGAGAIHGDPDDAIQSRSERVVYVHVDELPNKFNTTFSLAVSGKRYTIIEGDPVLYSGQISHYLTEWLAQPIANRWLRNLLSEAEIRRYNSDDVILVQDADSSDYVYLLLTGYCEVVQHDGKQLNSIAHLQAGDVIGEMASVTGKGARNASVVSRTPSTVCVFTEQTFSAFVSTQGIRDKLRLRWEMRAMVQNLPCFSNLGSNALLQLCAIAEPMLLGAGDQLTVSEESWYLLKSGTISDSAGQTFRNDSDALVEFGWQPLSLSSASDITAVDACEFIIFERQQFEARMLACPQLNYNLRKYRVQQSEQPTEWQLGMVAPD